MSDPDSSTTVAKTDLAVANARLRFTTHEESSDVSSSVVFV